MTNLREIVRAFVTDDEGATMVEYGLLVALIAIVVAVAALTLGGNVSNKFNSASNCVALPGSGTCP